MEKQYKEIEYQYTVKQKIFEMTKNSILVMLEKICDDLGFEKKWSINKEDIIFFIYRERSFISIPIPYKNFMEVIPKIPQTVALLTDCLERCPINFSIDSQIDELVV
jgi:hypothetical protein